jgi:hypothetical protein
MAQHELAMEQIVAYKTVSQIFLPPWASRFVAEGCPGRALDK